jgi:hypothetical protein
VARSFRWKRLKRERLGSMKLTNFYEVCDHKGDAIWGGAASLTAVDWLRRGLDHKLYVSVWNEEDIEEPILVIHKIDVTNLVHAAIMSERERD